jgi:serine/threonine protein kinase
MVNLPSNGSFDENSAHDIEDGKVKIIDIGSISNKVLCGGTPGFQDYCQLEIDLDIQGQSRGQTQVEKGKKVDIYQLGAIFFEIYSDIPFQSFDGVNLPNPMTTAELDKENGFSNLIRDMTRKDFENRPTIDEVISALEIFLAQAR